MMNKTALDIRALPQQGIHPKGDCGACCLAAVTDQSVQHIYDVFGEIGGDNLF